MSSGWKQAGFKKQKQNFKSNEIVALGWEAIGGRRGATKKSKHYTVLH